MPVIVTIVGLVAFVVGMSGWTRWWRIIDTPTSDAAHCFVGYNEVQGAVRPVVPPVRSPITGVEAVWWRYKVQRYESNGKNSSWNTKEEGTASAPFEIVDATGAALVVPVDAKVNTNYSSTLSEREIPTTLTFPQLRTLTNDQSRSFNLGFMAQMFGDDITDPIESLNGKWRVVEDALVVGETAFVTGDAVMRTDGVVGVVLTGAGEATLSIRAGTQQSALRSARTQTIIGLGAGVAALIAGPAIGHLPQLSVVIAVALGIVLIVGYVIRAFNRLVGVRQQAERAWSLIDVALQRRNDLLPNLVAVVQAAFAHESQLLADLASARVEAHVRRLPTAAEIADLTPHAVAGAAATAQLVALAEVYPDLKGQRNAAHLIAELRSTEDHVAFARRFFNDAVEVVRTRRESLPDRFLVGLAKVDDLEFLHFDMPAGPPGVAGANPRTLPPPRSLPGDGLLLDP